MIAVFSGFTFSELTVVRPLGFGLAFGVLADAFIVRMLVIPALLHLLGPAAWRLPRWLDRIPPRVDVEGTALRRPTAPRRNPSRSGGDGSRSANAVTAPGARTAPHHAGARERAAAA
jgi:RND superfamily putative drug exporter